MGSAAGTAPAVLILTGETASGKSDLAIELALRHNAEIIGADSRQIYRGMDIGTAAPTPEQRRLVPHHLVGFLDPTERYSVARFVTDALFCIDDIHARGKRALVVGGTGFYVRALCGDVALGPEVDPHARERMRREAELHDAEFLYAWLRLRAPERAAQLSSGDRYRVTRALETVLAPSAAPPKPEQHLRSRGMTWLKLWRRIEPGVLHDRIITRVDRMLALGFVDEAERVGARAVAADAVGYPHALAYLLGHMRDEELRAHLVRATRRYAKRQATWLRSEPGIIGMSGENARQDIAERVAALGGW